MSQQSRLSRPNEPTVAWFANGVSDADLEHMNIPLRDAGLPFLERRAFDAVATRERQTRLWEMLTEMEAGDFGAFAAQNHSVTFNVEGPELEKEREFGLIERFNRLLNAMVQCSSLVM
jgi:hypothetical protein